MGRKNKTKLLKYASHSLNASSIGDSDGRISSSDAHVPEFKVLTSQLRGLAETPPTSERHREMKYMFAALEKRDAELVVAKKLIRKLQSGLPSDHNGDGDSSVAINDDSYSDHNQGASNNEEFDRIKKENDELVEERNKLNIELKDTEENVKRLQVELKTLECNLEKTNKSLDDGQHSSLELIQKMKKSLKEAETGNDILKKELNTCQSSYSNALKELDKERGVRLEQDDRIRLFKQNEDISHKNLEQALKDIATAKEEISVLNTEIEEQKLSHSTSLQKLVLDREKLESRYEMINNGVQGIKKEVADAKKNLIQLRNENKELQQQLVATKADVKHYRDDGDACRNYIKKIEGKLNSANEISEKAVGDLRKEFHLAQQELMDAREQISSFELMMSSLSAELQEDTQAGESFSILDSVKKLKQSFLLEQRKQVFNLAAVEAKEAAHQKLVQQNNDLLKTINENELLKKEELLQSEEEKRKLTDELNSAKTTIKKTRKEKDSTVKKLKRLLAENSELLDNKKTLEEQLERSTSSFSNESVTSQGSEAVEDLEESIRSLKLSLRATEEKQTQITSQLMDKENENLDLHRTIVAYKSKIHEIEQNESQHQKTVSTMDSRLAELQRSSDVLQKRYEEDTLSLQQKLDAMEKELKVQEELNDQYKSDSETYKREYNSEKSKLQTEIVQLKNSISIQEADTAQMKELVAVAANEKCKLFEDIKELEKRLETVQQALNKEEESNKLFKGEMLMLKKTIDSVEEQKKASFNELSLLTRKLIESESSQTVKENKLIESNRKLEEEVDNLRTQITKQDIEIEKLSANVTVSDQALEDLTKLGEQKANEYAKNLQSVETKCEILSKKLEEKTTESSDRMDRIKEKEDRLEKVRLDFENEAQEMREKITRLEVDLAKAISDRNTVTSKVLGLEKLISERDVQVEKLIEEASCFDQKQELLTKEINEINKKFEDSMSPKRDKVLQLENRLEVMQTASKAQCKRLEDELSSARTSLEESFAQNRNLEEQFSEMQEKFKLMDELSATNQTISEELAEALKLKDVVADLEKQNEIIKSENAEERAGLVDELIDTKQKLVDSNKLIRELQDGLVSNDSEPVAEVSVIVPEQNHIINEMFPSLDPAVRQLVILLSENRNYSYGVLGLVVYGFLVHLYILFN